MNVIVQCCAAQAADDPEHVAHIHGPALPNCLMQSDHHSPRSHLNLHRGEWTYVILVEDSMYTGGGPERRIERYEDATQSFTEALRTARKDVGWQRVRHDRLGNPSGTRPRKGLAYGFLIEGPYRTATIIPTPRYV